jgi:hypothetical protein
MVAFAFRGTRETLPWWDLAEELWSKLPKCDPDLVSDLADAAGSISILDEALVWGISSHKMLDLENLVADDDKQHNVGGADHPLNGKVLSVGSDSDSGVGQDSDSEESVVSSPTLLTFQMA